MTAPEGAPDEYERLARLFGRPVASAVPVARVQEGPGGRAAGVRASVETAELFMYGEIGPWGVSSRDVLLACNQLRGRAEIKIYLNSIGGDVFEGIAIHNLLSRFPGRKVVYVDALAASIASLVALAGDHVVTAENAMWMVHEPRMFIAGGTKKTLQSALEQVDTAAAAMAETYARETGQTLEQVKAWMADEIWMDAKTAMERGFCDEVGPAAEPEPLGPEAAARLALFSNLPPALKAQLEHQPPPAAPTTAAPAATQEPQTMNFKLIAARLGLSENATEAEVIAAIARLQDSERTIQAKAQADLAKLQGDVSGLLALAGKPTLPEALGALQGMKAQAEKVAELEAKVAAETKARADAELTALIDQGKKDGKLAPALEPWAKSQTLDSLKAFLAAAVPVVTPAGGGLAPDDKGGGTAGIAALTDEQKKIAASIGVKPEDVQKLAAQARV